MLFAIQVIPFAQQQASTEDGKLVVLFNNGTWRYADSIIANHTKASSLTKIEIPATNPNDIIITHTGYSLAYNEKYEQASWVAYTLTKEKTNQLFSRTDKFIPDPYVKSGTANNKDYSASGYDRGHLAPAADMGWSSTTMDESFYYSNMSPQVPGFNRGIWKKLEEQVRTWAIENDSIYVVTGPVLTGSLPSIGANKVAVPKYFYKVILDYTRPEIKGIGFIIQNTPSKEPLQHFAVTIDSVEKFCGIDFFPALPDEEETAIERKLCETCWSWDIVKATKANNEAGNKKTSTTSNNTTAVQCSGITKSGRRCARMTKDASGRCYQH